MNFESVESYFIQADELKLLLAGAGVESWYGIPVSESSPDEPEDLHEEDVNRILAGLYQKEYVQWESGRVSVLEPAASLVRIIKNGEECQELIFKKESLPTIMVYLHKDQAALLEKSPWDQLAYRFLFMDKKKLEEAIKTNHFQFEEIKKSILFNGNILDTDSQGRQI